MTDNKNIFVVIRKDIADVLDGVVQIISAEHENIATSTTNIQTNINNLPFDNLIRAADKLFDTLEIVLQQVEDAAATLGAVNESVQVIAGKIDILDKQLASLRKTNKADIDSVLAKINTITNILRPLGPLSKP
jgi:prefoldin subunit 5